MAKVEEGTWLNLAIVYPGDAEVRRAATPQNNRFAPLFAAFDALQADAGARVRAHPVVWNDDCRDAVREQLLAMDGALVWVNPIEAGRSRAVLDALLREVAAAGRMVSAHPDVVLKLGTKDVLVDTRHLPWGSDCHRVGSLQQMREELPARLAGGALRVLKQHRGHSGIGVWKLQAEDAACSRLRVRHAQRGSAEEVLSLDQWIARCAPYFEGGGHMVDQAWQSRLDEGMLRCYLVQDRVVGFGAQAVNALYPAAAGAEAPQPGPRLYHGADFAPGQALKTQLELAWLAQVQSSLRISSQDLPLLWDCDFLFGARTAAGADTHVLCEINVSSVAPFPDSAIEPLVRATALRLAQARERRGGR